MDAFLELCQVTTEKLDRNLQDDEIAFLQWLYSSHVGEKTNNKINIINEDKKSYLP